MDIDWPKVTVVTLIYNTNPEYIIKAIESIRSNNYPKIQHIIVDDGSSDILPKQIVKEWIENENYECEFYENDKNLGICKSLNNVLEIATGKYWFICCDDIFFKNRIKHDVEVLESLPSQYSLLFSPVKHIDAAGKLMDGNDAFPFKEGNNQEINKKIFKELIKNNFISAPAVTFRTSALNLLGGFDESLIFEDYEIYLRLLHNGFFFSYSPDCKTYYRIHSTGVSQKRKIELELDIFKILIKYKNNKDAYLKLIRLFSKQVYCEQILVQHYTSLLKQNNMSLLPFQLIIKIEFINFNIKKILHKLFTLLNINIQLKFYSH